MVNFLIAFYNIVLSDKSVALLNCLFQIQPQHQPASLPYSGASPP